MPIADRVREQVSSFSGTGVITLPGLAVTGFQTFLAGWGASGSGLYCIAQGSQWEVGFGTINAGGTTLTRTKVDNGSGGLGVTVPFAGGTLDCSGNIPAKVMNGLAATAGRFSYVSATAVKFAPFSGDNICINGVIHKIPSAGIAGGANTGVYVNGVAGQNLAAATLYYVYAFQLAGVLTMDFSTTGHSQSSTAGNVGTEIKTGDDTRTLIGMVYTNASSQFVNTAAFRGVASYFNRVPRSLLGGGGTSSTSSTSPVELSTSQRVEFVAWADDMIRADISGSVYNTTAFSACVTKVGLDGTTSTGSSQTISASAVVNSPVSPIFQNNVTEGYHYLTQVGSVTANTGNWTTLLYGVIDGGSNV